MVFWDSIKDTCPVCRRATTLSVIGPHPTRAGLEICTFNCDKCGHQIESRQIRLARVLAPGVASMGELNELRDLGASCIS